MNTKAEVPAAEKRPNLAAGIAKRVGTIAAFLIAQLLILFLVSGQSGWIWPWVYAGISLGVMLINGSVMLRTGLETIAERGQPKETKDWDKVISGILVLFQYLSLPLIAGLDKRFSWSGEISVAWNLAGAALLAAGSGLTSWAMITNAFFSTAVRIQEERGHTVCSSGPYHFVRHPGYVGFILQSLGTAILLGSFWAVIPGSLASISIVIRTALEDRMLQAELSGYQDYVKDVRYRLIPGVW